MEYFYPTNDESINMGQALRDPGELFLLGPLQILDYSNDTSNLTSPCFDSNFNFNMLMESSNFNFIPESSQPCDLQKTDVSFTNNSIVPISTMLGNDLTEAINHSVNHILSRTPISNSIMDNNFSKLTNSVPNNSESVRYGYPQTNSHNFHVPRIKRTILSRRTRNSLQCGICGQPFERGNSLRRHEKLHLNLKEFKCVPCNREFSRRDIFMRHQKSVKCQQATLKAQGCQR